VIRYVRPDDNQAIFAAVQAAFGQADEARLVERLRTEQDSMFELAAEEAGEVVGHVMFSRLWADRTGLYAALAPLAVRPDLQRTGVGSALVRAGLANAREFGVSGVLVLGDPAYYPRFGFSAEAAARVRAPWQGHPAFMALALEEGAFEGPLSVAYPDPFAG
jgi:putative acetyltransferase